MKRKTYLKNRNYMPGFNRKANVKQLSMAMHIKVFDSATTEHSNYGSAVINRILFKFVAISHKEKVNIMWVDGNLDKIHNSQRLKAEERITHIVKLRRKNVKIRNNK